MADVVARFNEARLNSRDIENEFQLLKQIIKIIEREKSNEQSERYTFWTFERTIHALIVDHENRRLKEPLHIVAARREGAGSGPGHLLQIRRGFVNASAISAATTRFEGYLYQNKKGEWKHDCKS